MKIPMGCEKRVGHGTLCNGSKREILKQVKAKNFILVKSGEQDQVGLPCRGPVN